MIRLPLAIQCRAQYLTHSRHPINIAQYMFQTMLVEELILRRLGVC